MKKYIVVLLALASVHALLADPVTSQGGTIQLSSPMKEVASSMRVITQDEFDGKDPIVIHVNETLIIPVSYHIQILTNTPQLFFGPAGLSEISISIAGFTLSDDSGGVEFNLICTGTQVGNATIQFGEAGHVVKKFPMQVVG